MNQTTLLIGTRKGAFFLSSADRKTWKLSGPSMLGHIVHHIVSDPRDPKTLLMACKTGHLGPTVFRSINNGRTWTEAERPPAFPKAPEGEKGLAVEHVFWLTPGVATQPGVWWAGTSPPGLFRSGDGGKTWDSVAGFNANPMREKWVVDGTPDGATLHSIIVDPRNPDQMYAGVSAGGVFESRDGAASWRPLNRGCDAEFIPTPDPEYGHDPHCVRQHPILLDRFYQQNHCGIYRMDRGANSEEDRWDRIGRNMPKKVGDIGFGIALHPRDPLTAWVFPMDGTTVWPRTSPGGKPAMYITTDGGRKWKRQDAGLPREQAWFTVKRQALTTDQAKPVGVYFGTTSGEIWASRNEGDTWKCLAAHLPHIYSIEVAVR